jgi:hypothetical protein
MIGADEMVLHQRQLAFGEVPETMEQPLTHQPAEYRIAQKFEPFVIGGRPIRLIGARTVRNGARQKRLVTERITKRPFQFFEYRFQRISVP